MLRDVQWVHKPTNVPPRGHHLFLVEGTESFANLSSWSPTDRTWLISRAIKYNIRIYIYLFIDLFIHIHKIYIGCIPMRVYIYILWVLLCANRLVNGMTFQVAQNPKIMQFWWGQLNKKYWEHCFTHLYPITFFVARFSAPWKLHTTSPKHSDVSLKSLEHLAHP